MAVTVTLVAVVPDVREIVLVVLVPLHPVPVTAQEYDVAPETAGTVYVPDVPSQIGEGRLTDAGAAGSGLTGAVKV